MFPVFPCLKNGQIDVWGYRTPFLFLEWIGMNAMLIYVLGAQGILPAFGNGWYYKSENNTLVSNDIKFFRLNSSDNLSFLKYSTDRINVLLIVQVYWIQKHIFVNVWHSQRLGTLLYVLFAEIAFYGVLAGILHKLGIYWKL